MITKVKPGVIADQAVGTTQLADDGVTAAKIGADQVGASEMADNAIGASEVIDGSIGAADLAATLDLSGKTLTLPAANTPAFTKSYTSPNQTISQAGALTLAHSLGAMPTLIQVRLKCLTAELGYSIGDEVIWQLNHSGLTSRGVMVSPDATNLNVKFGNNANPFILLSKTTGTEGNVTNANWAAIFKAWA